MTPTLKAFLLANLSALLRGRFFMRKGHLPSTGHRVPESFAGVGVATNADPATDEAVIEILRAAGIRRVRLDFSYGDGENHIARFLEALLAADFDVLLHLVQPADAARAMPALNAAETWRKFVATTLDRFGTRIGIVEACSTVNRKRWAGYSLDGFLAAWQIAHDETRQRNITLAGPSVTDFEPVWNVGLLRLLRDRNLLPDIHTDNLFSERCTEPERWDHKILGHLLASLIRFNLIRKARLLQRLGADYGVPRLMSPSAFWTLPRIERFLPDSEQKQADYLSRYMVLCAASGALEAAWWGPLVCHREGLVDDGEFAYPKLERITHYAGVDGKAADFRARPALAALAAFAKHIPGSRYEGRLNRGNAGLEVHAFRSGEHLTHIAWTINGHTAATCDVYRDDDLVAAEWIDRDGQRLDEAPTLLTESPLYLRWPADKYVAVLDAAAPLTGVSIHRHIAGLRHYYHRDATWHGMVLAANRDEADLLIAALHPDHIGAPPTKRESLRLARNAIWRVQDPRRADGVLVAKKPVKHHLHKKLLDRLKPSKARRSWNGTAELLRRGIDAAAPVAWFEQRSGRDITQNWYLCENVEGSQSVGALFAATHNTNENPELVAHVANFVRRMHDRGIFFRDLSGGNLLISTRCESLHFQLIDTGRLRCFRRSLTRGMRLADLTRVTHKLDPAGRASFLQHYFARQNGPLSATVNIRFTLYDQKARIKRWLRRTELYKKLKR
ncbi:MAG: lipopolysaccharide kinase InaA family protein [Pseudazoarcus pumilus]|nr:lipopolysaccharide kinase InaA family protein [Pseudazoarcus pumilus]